VTERLVDAHLDMAMNVLAGRDLTIPAHEIRAREGGRSGCMTTLPELERGGVAIAFGTLYVGTNEFDADGNGVYRTPPGDSARKQLDVYRSWEDAGRIRIVRTRSDLADHLAAWETDRKLGIVVLIEGGDSISSPDELPWWFDAGVRLIGPAWSQTRYCGGTRRPGGLTPMGRDLIVAMRELGVILDMSHIAEASFWDAIETGPGRVVASHSNARAIVPGNLVITGDRQLTDDMIRAIGDHDGVIGLVLFNGFLTSEWEAMLISSVLTRTATSNFVTLEHVRAHAEHTAKLIGWDKVGIGSDFDGGLGADETPVEIDTSADLARIGDVVPHEARAGVLGENWLRVLSEALPS